MNLQHVVIFSCLLMLGCEKEITIREICDQQSKMCSDLNTDGHCNAQRSEVILARHFEKVQPNDENKYDLLMKFDEYSSCIALASKIEHIKLKDKKTSRINGYITSLNEIKRLIRETSDTSHPGLLYYFWSHNGDEKALEKLLSLENTQSMQTSEMQLLLATYYVKIDLEKTIEILYRALELNPDGEKPNNEIYTTLVNIFYKQKKYKQAYIWAVISIESGVENIELALLSEHLTAQGKSLDGLNKLAYKTQDEVESGNFISPRGF